MHEGMGRVRMLRFVLVCLVGIHAAKGLVKQCAVDDIVARNDSGIFVSVRDILDAKERFRECIVFVYLNKSFFSFEFGRYVFAVARVFPKVVFTQVEGNRAGYMMGAVRPKSLPVLIYLNKAKPSKMYTGSLTNATEVLLFVSEQTGQQPAMKTPELVMDWEVERSPGVHYEEGQILSFLSPPDSDNTPLVADPLFVFSVLFSSSYWLYRNIRWFYRRY
mmetsp:Transcript_8063/g.12996  ORF Transcript_8063/g.12996 Transcript_8063/m.12996 type:complete len:219 (-) Transcript_8063:670-1326(-)